MSRAARRRAGREAKAMPPPTLPVVDDKMFRGMFGSMALLADPARTSTSSTARSMLDQNIVQLRSAFSDLGLDVVHDERLAVAAVAGANIVLENIREQLRHYETHDTPRGVADSVGNAITMCAASMLSACGFEVFEGETPEELDQRAREAIAQRAQLDALEYRLQANDVSFLNGDYGVLGGWARDAAHVEQAKKATHDRLVAQMGPRRTGPVQWLVTDRTDKALAILEQISEDDASAPELAEQTAELRSLLTEDGGLLVVAFAPGVAP